MSRERLRSSFLLIAERPSMPASWARANSSSLLTTGQAAQERLLDRFNL
jgi:hypothetical protein